MNRTIRFRLYAGLVVLLLPGMRTEATDREPDTADDVVPGVIESAKKLEPSKKDNAVAECMVGSVKHKEFPGGEVRVLLTKETKLEKLVDGKRQPATFEDLKKGARIEFSGFDDILESNPPMVYVASVVIQEAKK